MLYHYTIYPLEYLLEIIFVILIGLSSSHLLAIILLAIVVQLSLKPLVRFASRSGAKQLEIESVLSPQVREINKSLFGLQRHEAIKRLYSRYSYHPIFAMRSLLVVFVQLPFFIAAYFMFSNFAGFSDVSVPGMGNLGVPDSLLYGGMHLMPFVMTAINMLAVITTPGFGRKNTIQGILVSILFFILLYEAPLGLLVYWTTANLFSLLSNLTKTSNLKVPTDCFKRSLPGRIFEEYGFIFLVTNLAILVPLLGVLGDQFNLFTAHGMTGKSVISIIIIIMLTPSIFLFSIRWFAKQIGLVGVFDVSVLFVFLGLFITYIFNKAGYGVFQLEHEPYILFAIAILATTFAVIVISRGQLQRILSYASLLILFFLLHFIYASSASTLFLDRDNSDLKYPVRIKDIPVFVLVFDEFSGLTLQDSKGELDSKRYPGFAELASQSDYYPNALTVSDYTAVAVPSLVSGNLRGAGKMGIAPRENLLELFQDQSTLHAYSSILPADLSYKQKPDYRSVSSDLLTLYLHIISHQSWIESILGPIPETWSGFGIFFQKAPPLGNKHLKKYFEWLSFIENSPAGRQFNFLHVQFPHAFYNTTSLGRNQTIGVSILPRYLGVSEESSTNKSEFIASQPLVNVAFHNYMQQSSYTDRLIKKFIVVLKDKDLFDESLVIVTADHGVSYDVDGLSRRIPRNKNSWGNIVSVPLFIKFPHQKSGRVNTAYVTLLDIPATIMGAIGDELPWDSVGENLKNLRGDAMTKSVELIPGFTHYFKNIESFFQVARNQKAALFGEGVPIHKVPVNYSLNSSYSSLLGANITNLSRGVDSNLKVILDRPINPKEISYYGTVYLQGSPTNNAILAVAVNGQIQAVFESGKIQTQEGFFALSLPELDIIPDTMDIKFYEIDDDNHSVLKRISGVQQWSERPSLELTPSQSIELHFMPSVLAEYGPLKRIGIRFGTYMRQNSGEAELRISGLDSPGYRHSFPLGTLSDNAYRYFDLQGEVITGGWINSLSGTGISAWEVHNEEGMILTCIDYEFLDGSRRFTPACPPP